MSYISKLSLIGMLWKYLPANSKLINPRCPIINYLGELNSVEKDFFQQ